MENLDKGSMRSFITAEIDEYYLEALRKYYLASGDKKSKVVDFPPEQPSPFLNGSEVIGKEDFSIIDSFNGVGPVILNHRFLVEGDGEVRFIVGVVLDSQAVSYLHQFVTDESGSFKATPRGLATHRLITKLVEYDRRGWDLSAVFYLRESLEKGSFEKVFPYAREFLASIFKLHTMDNEHFIKYGRIVPDPEKIEEYARRNESLQTRADNVIRLIADRGGSHQPQIGIQAIYATLLKIGLLKHERISNENKVQDLMRFFRNDLGTFLAREAVLSFLHFEGRSGNLVPLQVGAKDVKRKLLASAWDLFLLRLPETIIANEGNEHTSIYYVCSADKALQRLGRIFTTRRVASFNVEGSGVPSSVGFRKDVLNDEIGEELTAKFVGLYQQALTGRFFSSPRTLDEILLLVKTLENKASEIAEI